MRKKRTGLQNRTSMRNLPQYKTMTDAEFENAYSMMLTGMEKDEFLEEKVNKLRKDFEDEYDLSELLPNDRAVLDNLIHAMIDLEDHILMISNMKKSGVTAENIYMLEKLQTICKTLRADISSMQDDLGITRNKRKSDKEQSAIQALEDLKKRAKTFYQQKMQYIFCEKCGMLLSTVWWNDPQFKGNKITVRCHRHLDDEGGQCGWEAVITAKDLLENGGSNRMDLLPESMR